ncbi:hypothetical protein [Pseudarthrobacter sulfonivorans]|uniref:hypothetical protein n=1 Tax=Pseudarthrobacter sulfonivorans TaxID=121292 RepID=UPI002782C04C|nr:hypothetical protein [Pseudarthrobacter sulfonivorans]MDP9999294.1 hypothetical protein [Pseudarthrobacter sulfonivorans]
MRQPSALPDHLAGRSFTLAQQVQAGVPAGRAWRSDLRVASRGVRVPWGQEQPLHHTCTLLSALTPGAVCCLATAAQLWGCQLPMPLQNDLTVHLAKAGGRTRPVRKGVAGHRLSLRPQDVAMLDGVPVTSPARTWLDLAAVLDFESLVAAGDYFICSQARSFGPRKEAFCSLDDLREQVVVTPGVRGIRKARLALELCRVGADSAPETRLRLALGRVGLPEPALSYVVLDPTGGELAWPDMAFPKFKVAVNYDGRHHLEARQRESDIRRDESIAAAGWQSVTVTAGHVRTWGFDGCAHRVLDAMVRSGWRIDRGDPGAKLRS